MQSYKVNSIKHNFFRVTVLVIMLCYILGPAKIQLNKILHTISHNLKAPITIPDIKIRGDVISLFDAEMISGQTQIITINQGKRQGMKLGYTLGVYSPGKLVDDPIARTVSKHKFAVAKPLKVGIPPAHAATAIVYKVLNDISYAVITNSSHEVRNGYKIGNP